VFRGTKVISAIIITILILTVCHNVDANITESYGSISVPFIVNEGQVDDNVAAYAQIFNGTVFVTRSGEIVYSLAGSDSQPKMIVFRERFEGKRDIKIDYEDKSSTTISNFRGNDPSRWCSSISSYKIISLGEIYSGIELKLKAYGKNVEKLFYVQPGADPNNILISIPEARNLCIENSGELEIFSESGSATFTRPIAYQNINGVKTEVEVAYRMAGNKYGFIVGEYNREYTLIIDPLLTSTYLGGSGEEGWIYSGMIDNVIADDGTILVAGVTGSVDFPTLTGGYESVTRGNQDIFVARFNQGLSDLLSMAIIGGTDDDQSPQLHIYGSDIFLTGITYSTNFPTTPGSFEGSYSGSGDVIVSKFDANLSTLLASTYIGSPSFDGYYPSIAINNSGSVYISSNTSNSTFPTVSGGYSQIIEGYNDCYIVRFSNDLSTLTAGTFIGGQYEEKSGAIAITSEGNIVLATASESDDYPTTSGAYEESFSGPPQPGEYIHDVAISVFNSDLNTLIASTYIGSYDYEGASLLTVGSGGSIYVGGHTTSADYPTTSGVIDEVHNGQNEFFISKMSTDLTTLEASTFLTPNLSETFGFVYRTDIVCNADDDIILAGTAFDDSAFCTHDAYDLTFNGGRDLHVAILTNDLASVEYATYLGGTGDEGDVSVAVDDEGNIFVASYTTTTDFPKANGGWQSSHAGGEKDCIVAKLTSMQFTRITDGPHVNDGGWSFGVSWIDYDSDGYPDLYVNNDEFGSTGELNYLYHNNGDGTYNIVSEGDIANEGSSVASTWADYDNDGDIDGYVSNPGALNFLYNNNGDGTFIKAIAGPLGTVEEWTMEAEWVDYDNDGQLDLFAVNHQPYSQPITAALYRNEEMVFTRQTNSLIGLIEDECNSSTWGDYDNDGDRDLFWSRNANLTLFFDNDGDGTFSENTGIIIAQEPNKYHGNWADYDNDGDLDLYTGSGYPGTTHIYENLGNGDFALLTGQDISNDNGYWTGGYWGDYDNDGYQDLLILGQSYYNPYPNRLYHNLKNGTFERVTDGIVVTDNEPSSAACWADHDLDGDLDLFVANVNNYDNALYINNGNSNGWIQIRLIGTNSNRSGIGAKIRIKAVIEGEPVWQLQEVTGKTGFMSQDPLAAHFGLGDAGVVDSIKVEWPSGMVDILTDVSINQFLTVIESICGDVNDDESINIKDITDLIKYKYKDGATPQPYECLGDVNADISVNIKDITYLIKYKYKGGNAPEGNCCNPI
jgi:hypothetical protein